MKNFIINFILLILPIATAFAQVPPPPDFGEDASTPGAPSQTPIDQYMFILIVAAITITVYYILKNRETVVKA